MKKYNKPEIETLALETVDVIETSGQKAAAGALAATGKVDADKIQNIEQNIATMSTDWQW